MKDAMSKITDSNIYTHWQYEHKRCNEQDNWLPHIQALSEWTLMVQWARQLNPTSTSTGRMHRKMLWARQLTPTAISTIRLNKKEAMSKTTDSHIYKHWKNEHERSNEQDNWLSHLQALAEWTRKTQWTRQLTPTSARTDRMNMKDTMSKTTACHIYKH